MLREDSPECEEEEEEGEPAEGGMEEELEREVERRKRTPSGRRTPVCGRHRQVENSISNRLDVTLWCYKWMGWDGYRSPGGVYNGRPRDVGTFGHV